MVGLSITYTPNIHKHIIWLYIQKVVTLRIAEDVNNLVLEVDNDAASTQTDHIESLLLLSVGALCSCSTTCKVSTLTTLSLIT